MTTDSKLDLFFHRSPNSLKVLLFLEEAGLPYRIVPVDIYSGEQHTEAFLRVNPNAKVPALRDGDVTVFDSNAILLYLAEREGQFQGASAAQRGQVLSWLMFVASGLGPFSGQSVHFQKYSPERIPYAINRYTWEVERHYRVMNERLRRLPYLAGDDYTIADMGAWGWVSLANVALAGASLERYPDVQDWFEKVEARPAAVRARSVSSGVRSKDVLDEEARRLLFPQNVGLETAARGVSS